jgi:hypothetical protein
LSIFKDVAKARKWIEEKKIVIVLSLYRTEDGATIDYDIMAGDRLLNHVCSLPISEEELEKFYSRKWDKICKLH